MAKGLSVKRRARDVRLESMWARHDALWRDPAEVVAQWPGAGLVDPGLLRHKARGDWWEVLASSGRTLLVTREYEHLVVALASGASGPRVSYLPLPHPSGLAVDERRRVVYVASTRNPNQVFDLAPVTGFKDGSGVKKVSAEERTLVPIRSRFLPGGLYLHDLALVGGRLHANAVGENAVVRLDDDGGRYERVWWPRSIETEEGKLFDRNYLQLNSIAAGESLSDSYFSASTESPSARRPGHSNFPVDGRGVIFSGRTREPQVRGLTRPHSARLHRGRLWVNNSGYGEFCVAQGQGFETVARLPGWTRGLCFQGGIAFVATSRVIPRFRQYAPGLDVEKSLCGLHAVELKTGKVLGSLNWPAGNQIFALALLPGPVGTGLPFRAGAGRALDRERELFYSFRTFS